MKNYNIPEPINMTDKYFYAIAMGIMDIRNILGGTMIEQMEKEVIKAKKPVGFHEDGPIETETYEEILINEEDEDLEALTKGELVKLGATMGLTLNSRDKKDDLIKQIRGE